MSPSSSRSVLRAACAACILHGSGPARAEERGFELSAGILEARQEVSGFAASDLGVRVSAGYSINAYLAAEAGYIDAGELTDTLGTLRATVAADGVYGAARARLPLGRYVTPFVKLGYVFYDTQETISSGSQRASESSSDADLLYGIGCEFRVHDHFRIQLEYEEVDLPDAAFHMLSFSLVYRL